MENDNTIQYGKEAADAKDRGEPGFIPPEKHDNLYNLPRIFLNNNFYMYGSRVRSYLFPEDISLRERIELKRGLPIRDDDVLITTFFKSGTHWMCEIVHMLMHNTTEQEKHTKQFRMLELADAEYLEKLPSPRVLNSHLWTGHLPTEMFKKKTKMIHVVRNPKDVLVSFYHHFKNVAESGFSLDKCMKSLMQDDQWYTQNQFEQLRHMSEFQRSNPDHPFKVVYFEDMKRDPVAGIKELAEFLGVSRSEQFYREVADACDFKNMKTAENYKEKPGFYKKLPIKIYRKGEVGDWKNHLTVAQNEEFDAFIAKEVDKGGLDYSFTYE